MDNRLMFDLHKDIENIYVDEPEYFTKIRNNFVGANLEEQISSVEGNFLKMLVSISNSENILEIGSAFGYSTLWLASGLCSEKGRIIGIEKSKERFDIAINNIKNSSYHNLINLKLGDAINIISNMLPQSFDMVFIDANKSQYQIYARYADSLIKKNGMIIMDDIFLFTQSSEDKHSKMATSIENAKNYFINSGRFHISILPIAHGIMIARKLS